MNDYSPEHAPTAAFTPEQMAQLLFSVKNVMQQQQVLADFPLGTVNVLRLVDTGKQAGSDAAEQTKASRREN